MNSPVVEALVIRPMQVADLDQVLAIDQASFALPWPASAYRFELFENPNSQLWVAQNSNRRRNNGGYWDERCVADPG